MSEFYARLQQTRTKLLDLTKRNKLVSYKKPAKSRYLKIIDESPDFIYHRLVAEEYNPPNCQDNILKNLIPFNICYFTLYFQFVY